MQGTHANGGAQPPHIATGRKTRGGKDQLPLAKGMVPECDEEVEALALAYKKHRDKRMEFGREEVAKRVELEEMMEKKGLPTYNVGKFSVVITTAKKAKVKIDNDDDEDQDY